MSDDNWPSAWNFVVSMRVERPSSLVLCKGC